MQALNRLIKITLGPAFLLLAAFSVHAQAENPSATVPIRATVTVVGKNYTEAPKVTKDDVQVYDGKDKLTVSEWTPAQGDRWTWLILAAYTQLRLARGLGTELRRPWQRPLRPL